MTITTPERSATVEQRAAFLLDLADDVANEQSWQQKPKTDVIRWVVPVFASALCADPVLAFDGLVEARRELQRFNGDPVGYAAERDLSVAADALDRLYDRLESQVDAALQVLLGGGA